MSQPLLCRSWQTLFFCFVVVLEERIYLNSFVGSVAVIVLEMEEALRIICWTDVDKFSNLSFFSNFNTNCFSSVEFRPVTLATNVFRVAPDGPIISDRFREGRPIGSISSEWIWTLQELIILFIDMPKSGAINLALAFTQRKLRI